MLGRIRPRLTYANVMATIAVFMALGGTAIAAKPLLTGADIQDGTVTGADVQDNSLQGADILEPSLGQVPSAADADKLDGRDSTDFGGILSAKVVGVVGGALTYGSVTGISTGTSRTAVETLSPARPVVASDISLSTTNDYDIGRRVTLMVGGQPSALTCTVAYAQPQRTCSNTTDRVVIPAGSALALEIYNPLSNNTEASVGMRIGSP